ncbi:helix-turn-helix domain-containing protein [Lysinibacillus sp. 3P01SB]|uniref:helix-turn-helix domain-containing protein n=1 Tax=Lysinibacillus sp. 3P01SB TaxID=3132284 RepID=UPI0039A577BB
MKHIQIGRLIRRLRKERNLSMTEFATKINISQPSLSKIENGSREVSLTILENICLTCKLTMVDFFKMLHDDVNLDLGPIDDPNFNDMKDLETELVNMVKTLSPEQQKGLYVLLMPYIKK